MIIETYDEKAPQAGSYRRNDTEEVGEEFDIDTNEYDDEFEEFLLNKNLVIR